MAKIAFCPGNPDACALYRVFLPHLYTPESVYIYKPGPITREWYEGARVVVIQRLHAPEHFKAIQVLKSWGMKVIYDMDDNLWEVPTYNPAHRLLKGVRVGFEKCIQACDLITVSTAALKVALLRNVTLPKGIKVTVVNNAIDFNLFRPLPRNSETVKVGWAGTNTHTRDVAGVWNMLPGFLGANPNVELDFVGLPMPEVLRNNRRARQLEFVPVGEYPSRLSSWRFDVMLAPLEDNTFNRSKSNIKALEAAATGAVPLLSDVASYAQFCEHDPELKWLLCNTNGQWQTKLDALVNDAALRQYYRDRAHHVAFTHYNIENTVKQWHAVYESML
jgi:glycosyltransferase involved in cell wall biosynthesis